MPTKIAYIEYVQTYIFNLDFDIAYSKRIQHTILSFASNLKLGID